MLYRSLKNCLHLTLLWSQQEGDVIFSTYLKPYMGNMDLTAWIELACFTSFNLLNRLLYVILIDGD